MYIGDTMTRYRLIKAIMEETGCDKETVSNVIESLEYKVLDAIAMEDQIDFVFGSIYGTTRPSRKITGYVSMLPEINKQKAWSSAFLGYPMVKFSKEAKRCDRVYANEFFSWPENRYTSLARKYRLDVGEPEIPEYEGLSEEQIEALCKRADEEKEGPLSYKKQKEKERRERKSKKDQIARDLLYIQQDLEKQRQMGIPEDCLVERPIEEIKADMAIEWWEKHQDFKRYWKGYLASPEEVQKKHEANKKRAKEYQEHIKRQAELKQLRDEKITPDKAVLPDYLAEVIKNDGETSKTGDS